MRNFTSIVALVSFALFAISSVSAAPSQVENVAKDGNGGANALKKTTGTLLYTWTWLHRRVRRKLTDNVKRKGENGYDKNKLSWIIKDTKQALKSYCEWDAVSFLFVYLPLFISFLCDHDIVW